MKNYNLFQLLEGKGGGKAESAQAQGKNAKNLEKAVEICIKFAEEKLK
jgi:alanyl-tRNA synthetase